MNIRKTFGLALAGLALLAGCATVQPRYGIRDKGYTMYEGTYDDLQRMGAVLNGDATLYTDNQWYTIRGVPKGKYYDITKLYQEADTNKDGLVSENEKGCVFHKVLAPKARKVDDVLENFRSGRYLSMIKPENCEK